MEDKNVRKLVYLICYKLLTAVILIIATDSCFKDGGPVKIISGIILIIMIVSELLWILMDVAGFLCGRENAKQAFENITNDVDSMGFSYTKQLGEQSVKREDIEKK